jgi:hypothetical protein
MQCGSGSPSSPVFEDFFGFPVPIIRHSFPTIWYMKNLVMEMVGKREDSVKHESHKEVNMAAVITVIALVLFFIGASFYLVIDSYLEATT